MTLNVPPVVGMTPAQVAIELRTLIRDKLLPKSGFTPTSMHGMDNNKVRLQNTKEQTRLAFGETRLALDMIAGAASHRKPNEIRALVKEAEAQLSVSSRAFEENVIYQDWFLNRAYSLAQQSPGHQLQHQEVTRAYALVQALPTVPSAPTDRAENVIRAIAAMVKVYFGVEVEATIAQLPEIMPTLMAMIKPTVDLPKEEIAPPLEPKPTPLPEDTTVPANPAPTHQTAGFEVLTAQVTLPWLVKVDGAVTNLLDWGVLPSAWVGGHCSPEKALRAFLAVRRQSSADRVRLTDSSGDFGRRFAEGRLGEEITTYNAMGKILEKIMEEAPSATF